GGAAVATRRQAHVRRAGPFPPGPQHVSQAHHLGHISTMPESRRRIAATNGGRTGPVRNRPELATFMARTVQAAKGELMFLITGATGNIGGKLVQLLSERGHPVRALVRDPARARFPAGVEVVVADLDDPDSVVRAAKGV